MQPGGEPGCYFSSFSIEYPIDYAAVGIVYLLPIEINVDVGHRISSMPKAAAIVSLGMSSEAATVAQLWRAQ